MRKKQEIKTPSEYAKLKNVVPSRITYLKPKLKKKQIGSRWFVVDCEENDKLFNNVAYNANRKA